MIYNLDITLAFHVFQAFYLHSVHLDTLCALFFFALIYLQKDNHCQKLRTFVQALQT